jgi:hypothetical protein
MQILEATSADKLGELKKAHVVHAGPKAINMALEGTDGANATSATGDMVGAFIHFERTCTMPSLVC